MLKDFLKPGVFFIILWISTIYLQTWFENFLGNYDYIIPINSWIK